MEGEPILKKTLVTMAAMVSACIVFVGTLSLVAVLVVSRAVNPSGATDSSPSDKSDKTETTPSGSKSPGKPGASGAKSAHEQI
jgi:hypothetical protein